MIEQRSIGPLHGELLGADQLADRARALARSRTVIGDQARPRRAALLERLRQNRRILSEAHAQLADAAARSVDVGPAGAWLLDNYHVVQEHVLEVRQSLPRGYYRELPELSAGPLAGYPRVYELAITLISHTEARIDLDNVDLFIGAFQEAQQLSIGELWAIPAMLRLGLIESVRRMALRTIERLKQIEDADRRAGELLGATRLSRSELAAAVRAFISDPPRLTSTFVARFLYTLREGRGDHSALVDLEEWIGTEGLRSELASARSTQRVAITHIMMANSITSLRAIGRLDWNTLVERQSALEAVLRQDPALSYARMTFATRDHYRHAVEHIAKRTRLEETIVADHAIRLASRTGMRDYRAHVGYYLIDDGLGELERSCGYRPTGAELLRRLVLRHPHAFFGTCIAGITAIFIAAFGLIVASVAYAALLVAVLLLFVPALDVAIHIVNQLVSAWLPPRLIPKLDLAGARGIGAEFRTAVVIPTLFADVAAVLEALETIEVQYLANREPNLHFAVLSDFTDATSASCEGDAAIVAAAVRGVNQLNARYAPETADAFFLFHRARLWNAREGVWMGWERKRGKLAQFNRYLRGGERAAFATVVGATEQLGNVKYVITLDADTVLPPGTATALVGAIAHPLNRAVHDDARGRVVRGFGILQPRVGVSLPSARRSRFAAIASGPPGVDPYTTAVSDVYQDLFGEGSFTGKGIYDVDAFEHAMHGRFPENRLLSHDLIEGSYARAGLVTDIVLYDDYPTHYLTYSRRKHRWIRGDWQLLDWLTPVVAGPDGPERNRLSLLSRWKIFDNLRRSTVEVGQLALMVGGWTVLPGSPLAWTGVAVGSIVAPWLASLLLAAVRPPLDKSWLAYYSAVGRDARTSVQQALLTIAFLPHQAFVSSDAIVRTLWRVLVSKRQLIQWQTASRVEQIRSDSRWATWRAMAPGLAVAIAAAALVAASVAPASVDAIAVMIACAPILLLWLSAPAIANALSKPPRQKSRELTAQNRERALRYAEPHWRYFDRFVGPDTNGLVPDNHQEDPTPVTALRTSPTNIGLQLLSTVSACDLGFITIEDMTDRLELAFAALDRLDRFRGHFYNWYNLDDLSVLEPAYISTVDSGNLAGHLIALRQALIAIRQQSSSMRESPTLAGSTADLAARLAALAARAYSFALAMDFGFLYDAERHLFAIGFHTDSHARDSSYYDLLASEARLASFVAIAKNDVPVEHWFHLGRTLTHNAGATALLSWSGSMFEYLMPALVMESLPLTLIEQTYRGAVQRQIAHGRSHGVPWGISESAYALRDRHGTYQYHAFGVPGLGLKHGLDQDLVVAPYASALALMIEPARALANLSRLEDIGALGPYGFRDAIDYTRAPQGERFALVRTYMAHHVGMSFLALANALEAGVWQRRFHADPIVRATELLLHERIPRRLVLQEANAPDSPEVMPESAVDHPSVREFESADTIQPHVALLGQLPYTIMISHCGGGYSRFEDLAITRWRSDATTDNMGQFCYIKDLKRAHTWSAAHQPVCATADRYRAVFSTDRVTFQRADGDIETRTEITIVPEDSAEVRRVTVTNNGADTREVELTSYGEVVLAPPEAERAHPAFANLFVKTEFHEWCSAITATRRPRSATDRSLICVHVVATDKKRVGDVTCETDRARFIGRGRSTREPIALDLDGALSGTTGAVLDPIFALRTRVRLHPGESAAIAFTTLVAPTRERAFELADRYHTPHAAQRALDLAWTATQVELRELNLSPADASVFQELAGHLLYSSVGLGPSAADRAGSDGAQPLLWSIGVSGDRPILLARIDSPAGLPTLRQLFSAHHYWRRRGLQVDLVVLNNETETYLLELDDRLRAALAGSADAGVIDQPGGVYFIRNDIVADDVLRMLRAVARVHISCDGSSLADMLAAATGARVAPLSRALEDSTKRVIKEQQALQVAQSTNGKPGLLFDNGLGGLGADYDYHIRVHGDVVPPAPWSNIIANQHGGFLVTERGAGFTWADSSYFFRLTPWHNDPVTDPPGDALYLQDEESGLLWSPTPAPVESKAAYAVRHGAGSSSFEHTFAQIRSELDVGIADHEVVRISTLRLTNLGEKPRTIRLTAYVEWTLGVLREQTRHHVRTTCRPDQSAMYAANGFDPQYAQWRAFCALSEPLTGYTADRREFLGRNGTMADPKALGDRELKQVTGAGLDPCAALQCRVTLAPGEARTVVIVLGAAESEAAAQVAVDRYRAVAPAEQALAASVARWRKRLSVVAVRTPDAAFDAMMNQWALYQALACRMWARTGFYQSNGAYGFRDQLQDIMAFVYAEPAVAREHILRAAARQFIAGDVQHWWHPQSGRGVRTRYSDDLAWLPFATEHYTRVTGDTGVLDVQVPFVSMPTLHPGEDEIYDVPSITGETATLYEHCRRALMKACTQGEHELPLMGTGDWNDGMNRVGVGGRGESVWLAWFLIVTLRRFASVAAERGDSSTASAFRTQIKRYARAVENSAWDGEWYLRAWFDDGSPLGSAQNAECRIDAIAQSWSVICGTASAARQQEAMAALEKHLIRNDARIIQLLTPAFDKTERDPGYIKGYLPGVRENGAQYTHAALWTVLAMSLQGHNDRAFELFQMINPLTRSATNADMSNYKVEPYVVAADVYTAENQLGRGGWTWYTGSASWLYRIGLESILGFTKRGATLVIKPGVPADWSEYSIEYRYFTSTYAITVTCGEDAAYPILDDVGLEDEVIPLHDDGRLHTVRITVVASDEANRRRANLSSS